MLRTARIAIPDIPHHITQRGNNRQDVFFVDNDRRNTHTGRPLAEDALISKLEKLLNKRLRPLPIGRPRRASGNQQTQ